MKTAEILQNELQSLVVEIERSLNFLHRSSDWKSEEEIGWAQEQIISLNNLLLAINLGHL